MSCFCVSYDHINALMTWAALEDVYIWDRSERKRVCVDANNADRFGQILADENCRSFNHRYVEQLKENGPVDALDYVFKLFPVALTPVEVIRACGCLNYQSCETDNWPETAAAQILRELVDAAAHKIHDVKTSDIWEIDSYKLDELTNHHGATPKQKGRKHG